MQGIDGWFYAGKFTTDINLFVGLNNLFVRLHAFLSPPETKVNPRLSISFVMLKLWNWWQTQQQQQQQQQQQIKTITTTRRVRNWRRICRPDFLFSPAMSMIHGFRCRKTRPKSIFRKVFSLKKRGKRVRRRRRIPKTRPSWELFRLTLSVSYIHSHCDNPSQCSSSIARQVKSIILFFSFFHLWMTVSIFSSLELSDFWGHIWTGEKEILFGEVKKVTEKQKMWRLKVSHASPALNFIPETSQFSIIGPLSRLAIDRGTSLVIRGIFSPPGSEICPDRVNWHLLPIEFRTSTPPTSATYNTLKKWRKRRNLFVILCSFLSISPLLLPVACPQFLETCLRLRANEAIRHKHTKYFHFLRVCVSFKPATTLTTAIFNLKCGRNCKYLPKLKKEKID